MQLRYRNFVKIGLLACVGFLTILCGCSRGPKFELTEVSGVVKIDGRPAAGILVQFMPDVAKEGKGPTSQGTSNEAGEFTLLTTTGKPGAAIGNHVVIFADTLEERPAQGEVSTKPIRLPHRFTTAAGGIQVTVEPGKAQELNIVTTQ